MTGMAEAQIVPPTQTPPSPPPKEPISVQTADAAPTPQVGAASGTSENAEVATGVPDNSPQNDSFFHPDQDTSENRADTQVKSISWEATEFHNHEKTSSWYVVLGVVTVCSAILLYFVAKSIVPVLVVILGGIAIGVVGRRKPNQLSYKMNDKGIRIGNKEYLFDEFRLFIVNPESSVSELTLVPTKRFMPSLSIIFDQKDEQKILDILSQALPYEERRQDLIDVVMHKLRF